MAKAARYETSTGVEIEQSLKYKDSKNTKKNSTKVAFLCLQQYALLTKKRPNRFL